MGSYVALLRGINVGGRNKVAMTALADCFSAAGCAGVRTHLQSGNVVFVSREPAAARLEDQLERALLVAFGFAIPTLVRSAAELAETVRSAPADHGSPHLRSDVFFLKRPLRASEVMAQLPVLREGVDTVTPGPDAIYFSRVAALATKTRIQRLMALPVFQQMTVRSWRTVTRLLELVNEA